MPSKVAGYYTTDDPYRNVGSNHINGVRYENQSKTLFIDYWNGARYKYYGVPRDLYEGLMKAPSHGTFLWPNIRQSFPYDLIDEDGNIIRSGGPSKPTGSSTLNFKDKPIPTPSTINQTIPELGKLDKLDTQESVLEKELRQRKITQEQFDSALNVIKGKREALTKKLEKSGYFPEEENPLQEDLKDNIIIEELHKDYTAGFISVLLVLLNVTFLTIKLSIQVIAGLLLMFVTIGALCVKK